MKIKDRFLKFTEGKLRKVNPENDYHFWDGDILDHEQMFLERNGFFEEQDIWQEFDWGSITGVYVNTEEASFMLTVSIDPAGHFIYFPSAADYMEFFRLYVTPGRCNIPYMDWRQDKMSNDPDFNSDAFDPVE